MTREDKFSEESGEREQRLSVPNNDGLAPNP